MKSFTEVMRLLLLPPLLLLLRLLLLPAAAREACLNWGGELTALMNFMN